VFPGARITILARINAMAEPFRRLREIDQVFVTGKSFKGILRSILWARRQHADVYLVPFPSNRWQYSLLALFSGAKIKLLHGYPVGKISALGFIGDRIPAERGLHDVVQNLRLLAAVGAKIDEQQAPIFPLTDGDRARATQLLESIGFFARTPYIALHAGSATTILTEAKRWPPTRYAELIRALRSELPHEILVLQGPDESGVADEILANLGERRDGVTVLNLAGPLGDAAAILQRAALYVGTDSGLAHLAAAVGTRAVTLFAPADPDRVCPFGNRDLVVQPGKQCTPCFLYPWQATRPKMKCTPPFCVTEIKVDQVMQAIRRALTKNEIQSDELCSGRAAGSLASEQKDSGS
jgi:ADP-heptose:LPS heptosyltransferase